MRMGIGDHGSFGRSSPILSRDEAARWTAGTVWEFPGRQLWHFTRPESLSFMRENSIPLSAGAIDGSRFVWLTADPDDEAASMRGPVCLEVAARLEHVLNIGELSERYVTVEEFRRDADARFPSMALDEALRAMGYEAMAWHEPNPRYVACVDPALVAIIGN